MPYKDQERRRIEAAKRGVKWRAAHPGRANEVRRNYYYRNQEDQQKRAREWYHANRDKCLAAIRIGRLKRYGLTPDGYAALGNSCGICGATEDSRTQASTKKKFKLAVDHCHDTKKIRGLLCGNCNCAIGYLKHDIDLLRKAIDYLERTV